MPQCDFFVTGKDEARVVDWILSCDGCLVPSLDYDTPQYEEVRSSKEYLNARERTNLFFILHPSFYECALAIKRHSSGPKAGKYFLIQRVGGPALSWFVPRIYEKGGIILPAGMVAYDPTYRKVVHGENQKVPKSISSFYLDLLKVLKEGAVPRKLELRTYWIARDALEAFRDGSIRPGLDIEI